MSKTNIKIPKITIVTPNYNLGEYLEQTILSVLNQNYPNLEYIIIDGGSTDNSLEIIKKYEEKLTYWVSEPDNGMYEAIQKGFDKSTGDIMGWLNSDDMLHSESLFYVGKIFSQFSEIDWIQGRPTFFDKKGGLINMSPIKRWSKYHFYTGQYKWLQQESTFWRRKLWNISDAKLNTNLKLAGDFDLWLRFFNHAEIYCISVALGGFRVRGDNQLSHVFHDNYLQEAEIQRKNMVSRFSFMEKIKITLFNFIIYIIKIIKTTKIFNNYALEFKILPLIFNSPPILFWDYKSQTFKYEN